MDQSKEKGKVSSLQLEIEEGLKSMKKLLADSLNRNSQLERDLIRVKKNPSKNLLNGLPLPSFCPV